MANRVSVVRRPGLLEPTDYEIEPLVVDDQPDTGVSRRAGHAWVGFMMTNTIDGTEYVHLPMGVDDPLVSAPVAWLAHRTRPRRARGGSITGCCRTRATANRGFRRDGSIRQRRNSATGGIRSM